MKHLIYAIGDIHGCLRTLDALWHQIQHHMNQNPEAKKTVVFLGDYVDRGPDSAGVIHRVMEMTRLLEPHGIEVVALMGNHEDMMNAYINQPLSFYAANWFSNGGQETLNSYADGEIPEDHQEWVKNLKPWHQEGRFIFVHAGIEPLCEMEHQYHNNLLWDRRFVDYDGPFDDDEKLFVIHGHTPVHQVSMNKHQVNIDTGCVFGGRLTCVIIDVDQTDNNFSYFQEPCIDRE